MKIEQWTLSEIKPYPGNPRQNDAAVDAVAASIKEFGFRQPIVVDNRHNRHLATIRQISPACGTKTARFETGIVIYY